MFKGRTETGAASELVFGFCSKECYEWFDTNQLPMEGLLVLIQGNLKDEKNGTQ